eukprot:TRINITY_DN1514_c0_g1_i3.p1 TRINITY_DN1514_c0_g1~~TRINITY_DN1514_c0_g1_i3.p1  ORF type:complete len:174 (+),score=23.19 TRINITY_DN1514_c0_g1_i3:77-598(+)
MCIRDSYQYNKQHGKEYRDQLDTLTRLLLHVMDRFEEAVKQVNEICGHDKELINQLRKLASEEVRAVNLEREIQENTDRLSKALHYHERERDSNNLKSIICSNILLKFNQIDFSEVSNEVLENISQCLNKTSSSLTYAKEVLSDASQEASFIEALSLLNGHIEKIKQLQEQRN